MLKPCRDQEGLIKISYEIKIFICVLKAKFFVLADILSLGSDSVNPHIFLPPDQNVADQMDPDPGPQLLSTGFNYVFVCQGRRYEKVPEESSSPGGGGEGWNPGLQVLIYTRSQIQPNLDSRETCSIWSS